MESANMSNYRLMAPEPLKLWPNDSKKVENSWRHSIYVYQDSKHTDAHKSCPQACFTTQMAFASSLL